MDNIQEIKSKNIKTKTNVYIDGANLKKGVEFLDHEINYVKLFLWLKKKYKAEKVIIFLGYIKKLEPFYESLRDIGYVIIFKETFFEGNILKANCDAELILNCVSDFYKKEYTNAIVITGDGDFSCLVKFLEQENALARVVSPNIKRCSVFLKRTTTKIVYIENMLDILCEKNMSTENAFSQKEKAPSEGSPVLGSFS
jgi:uncharacterized LabA/DUF88 family protein